MTRYNIDNFKRFNDQYGHEAGDRVLATLGSHTRSQIRRSDIACRFGGEEFFVLLPHSSAEDAIKRAEVLRRTTFALEVSHKGRPLEAVTISCGVASLHDHAEDARGLIHAADVALYASKRNGRNQVTCADSPKRPIVANPATRSLSPETA